MRQHKDKGPGQNIRLLFKKNKDAGKQRDLGLGTSLRSVTTGALRMRQVGGRTMHRQKLAGSSD